MRRGRGEGGREGGEGGGREGGYMSVSVMRVPLTRYFAW